MDGNRFFILLNSSAPSLRKFDSVDWMTFELQSSPIPPGYPFLFLFLCFFLWFFFFVFHYFSPNSSHISFSNSCSHQKRVTFLSLLWKRIRDLICASGIEREFGGYFSASKIVYFTQTISCKFNFFHCIGTKIEFTFLICYMMVIYFCAIKFMFAKYLLFHDGNRQKSEKKVKNKRGFFVIRIQRKKLRFHFVYPQGLRFFSRVRLSHYVGLSVGLSAAL